MLFLGVKLVRYRIANKDVVLRIQRQRDVFNTFSLGIAQISCHFDEPMRHTTRWVWFQ